MSQAGKSFGKRSQPSYFMSILGVSLVLFILGLLGWIVINANKLGRSLKENVELKVYLRENISNKDSTRLVNYITGQSYIRDYKFITKEQAKQNFIKDGNTTWDKVLDFNPLPASIEFKLISEYVNPDSLKLIKSDLESNIGVSEVEYPSAVVDKLNQNVQQVSIVLLVIAVILSVVVIVLIDNTIKLAMFSNRFLIKTMQMVGATRWFIARPMNMRAVVNGAISGIIALIALFALIYFAEEHVNEMKALRDPFWLMILAVGIILLGIVISLISTHRSIIKYLKMKLDELY